ncbi:MAG: SH3 domain-containing protein [Lachnospiraceae bacterium]|nr:SH3 domain-containing protein [Lachnospiraceae bacterium]
MLKRYTLEIEIAVIVLLIFLLCLKSQKKEERNDRLTEGEHQVVEITEDGVIRTADGRVYFPTGYVKPGEVTPTQAPTPTPSAESELERRLNALSEENREKYRKATTMTIPDGIAFAKVEEFLNVREKPDANAKKIGILYPNNYCIVESVEGEWAKIRSGSVKGYCKMSYLMTGEEAVRYAKETAVCRATTNATANVRSSATTKESNVVAKVQKGKSYSVIEPAVLSDDPDYPLFCKVQNGGNISYIVLNLVNVEYTWTAGKPVQ